MPQTATAEFTPPSLEHLDRAIVEAFPRHPFEELVPVENLEQMLAEYLAMSEGFPYVQAGAGSEVFWSCLDRREPLGAAHRITTVVGTFLVWDETGAWAATRDVGAAGLGAILDTRRFHASLLSRDLEVLFGRPVVARYSQRTQAYLRQLQATLKAADPVGRCAAMVAFERHANRMIESLWDLLHRQLGAVKEELVYFRTHVGGDDPAEAWHVAMTGEMVSRLVPPHCGHQFVDEVLRCYALSHGWCADITRPEVRG